MAFFFPPKRTGHGKIVPRGVSPSCSKTTPSNDKEALHELTLCSPAFELEELSVDSLASTTAEPAPMICWYRLSDSGCEGLEKRADLLVEATTCVSRVTAPTESIVSCDSGGQLFGHVVPIPSGELVDCPAEVSTGVESSDVLSTLVGRDPPRIVCEYRVALTESCGGSTDPMFGLE